MMKVARKVMGDTELVWNEKKWSEAHVKCASLRSDQGDTVAGAAQVIKALTEGVAFSMPISSSLSITFLSSFTTN